MLLENKIAVIYGASGGIGSAVAASFASEGARVYLVGRTLAKLQRVAESIRASGGQADVAVADALNLHAVEKHLAKVVASEGRIDISFNAISINDIQGSHLTDMRYDDFMSPIANAMCSYFNTATAAARHMRTKKSGTILAITANAGHHPFEFCGGFGVACAAIEAFCRQVAAENGPLGIRVVCLRSAGSPDTPSVDHALNIHAASEGISRAEFDRRFAQSTMLRRLPLVGEIAQAAALMASDKASASTATVLNLTCGEIAD
jgi:NAD(P)-dependent dehydrogenase (short-subunit alcohol dehydrogenase family)